MPKVRQLDEAARSRLAEIVDQSAGDGPMRGAYQLRFLYGRDVIPSRRTWIEHFCKIEDGVTGELVAFQMNSVQRDVEAWRLRCEKQKVPQRAVFLKSRHHGISTLFVAYGQEAVLRDPSDALFRAGIVAQDDATSSELLENGKLMRDNLPWSLPVRYDNRSRLWYAKPINGFVDILTAKTKIGGRGKHFRFLHMTEVAFWDDPERTFVALSQTVPHHPDTLLSIETTANGAGGWFYDFFWDAWQGRNDFTAMFFPWMRDTRLRMPCTRDDIERIRDTLDDEEKELIVRFQVTFEQLKWRRYAIANLCGGSLDLFHQEYPSTPQEAFITSGRPVFPASLVHRSKAACPEKPIWRGDLIVTKKEPGNVSYHMHENDRGDLLLWAEPRDGATYCIGSDSAEGVGGDYSVACVAEVSTGCQVAEFSSNRIDPGEFGYVIMALAQHFNRAWWLPETNFPGNATLQSGIDAAYEHIIRQPVFGRAGKVIDFRYGWQTREESKRLMVREMRIDLASEHLHLCSVRTCDEMLAYQIERQGSQERYTAPRGSNDDHVIAWGLTIMARKLVYEQDLEEENEEPPESAVERHWREWSESVDEEAEEEEDSYEDEDW